MMTPKNKRFLTIVGIVLVIFVIWYFFFGGAKQVKSSFGFSFGAVTKTPAPLKYKIPVASDNSADGNGQIQWGPKVTGVSPYPGSGDLGTPIVWYGTGSTYTNPLVLLWSGTIPLTEGGTAIDGVQFPTGVTLGNDQMNVLNWYLNQDSINAYMSDKQNDGTYSYSFSSPTNADAVVNTKVYGTLDDLGLLSPYGWNGPYIGLNISDVNNGGIGDKTWPKVANGDAGSASTQGSRRTVGFLTAIQGYTQLYTYITGIQGSPSSSGSAVLGYGLANIPVGNNNGYSSNGKVQDMVGAWPASSMSATAGAIGIALKDGAGDDSTFYPPVNPTRKADGSIDAVSDVSNDHMVQSKYFKFDGPTKHAVWSILLARQNQLLARLDPAIIGKL